MLNRDSELLDACCPMLVVAGNNETDEEFRIRWTKFQNLPENIKEIMSSMDTSEVVLRIIDQYKFSINEAKEISRIIRSYFFGEVPLNSISKKIADKISVDYFLAEKIAQVIKDEILFSVPKKDSSVAVIKKVDLSLLQAIQQYSQLGEQLITSAPIKLKIFPQMVRPSIKNWIEDYRTTMGAQKHGMMERGNYLFHTENTKVLTSGDRKKLAEVLRSLDEDVALPVDPDRQEVVFEVVPVIESRDREIAESLVTKPLATRISNPVVQSPVRFSSPQTLPNEKNDNRVTESLVTRSLNNNSKPMFNSQAGRLWNPQEERREPTVRGNVVDLKN